eukprot:5740107-Prorocentrum_lima.AAC.1
MPLISRRMRSIIPSPTIVTALRSASVCVKHTLKPNVVGASSQDDQHAADASTTDADPRHESCL